MWSKIREKFVKINLEKARMTKVSQQLEEFYEYFIFLEDYISHKNCDVFKSQNKLEIERKVYDEIMGNTYENVEDVAENVVPNVVEDSDESFNIDDFPNANSIYNIEDESIEILSGFEDIVYSNLENEKMKENINKKSDNGKNRKDISSGFEGIVHNNLKNEKMKQNINGKSDNVKIGKKGIGQENLITVSKAFNKRDSYPLTPVMSPFKDVNKTEMIVGSLRAKHDQLIDDKKDNVIVPIGQILNQAISEQGTLNLKIKCLQIILNSIKNFCEKAV